MIGGRNGRRGLTATGLLVGMLVAPALVTGPAEAATGPAPAPQAATMTDLGTLPRGTTSIAVAINARGQVVGSGDTANGGGHAFRWTASDGMQDLGTLPGMDISFASAINVMGQVIGDSFSSAPGGVQHAFVVAPLGLHLDM